MDISKSSGTVVLNNLIAGNLDYGVVVTDGGVVGSATGTVITGNRIGTNAAGTAALPNAGGIVLDRATNTMIGGTTASERNIISGNAGFGVDLQSAGAGNSIRGNYFGVNAAGTTPLPNYFNGNNALDIFGKGTIGGLTTTPGTGAGNLFGGMVQLTGASTLLGNTFGLQADGTTILGVAVPAILASSGIRSEAAGSMIGGTAAGSRNVFAGYGAANFNGNSYLDILGGGTNTVQGNYFGTDITGLLNRNPGDVRGIQTAFGASGNIVGGPTAAARNIIVGGSRGFETYDTDNIFEGNYVGIAADGVTAYGMSQVGVFIRDNNTIRGNVISGSSTVAGLRLEDTSTGSIIVGNSIGTDASGTLARPNLIGISVGTSGNTIGGTTAGARNTISGNAGNGIDISSNNILSGTVNYWKADGITNDVVGGNTGTLQNGATYATGISGQAFSLDGVNDYVQFNRPAAVQDFTLDSWVYIDPLTNVGERVVVGWDDYQYVSSGPRQAIVLKSSSPSYGGANAADGRPAFGILNGATFDRISAPSALTAGWHHLAGVRSGNSLRLYVDGVQVASTTSTILNALQPNDSLVIGRSNTHPGLANPAHFSGRVDETALYNRALSLTEIRNIQSLSGAAKVSNTVQGNYIGTNAAGTADLGNGGSGVSVQSGSPGNRIGGSAAGAGNVISGNDQYGISTSGSGTFIPGNLIGTNAVGTAAVGNTFDGILSTGIGTHIGGSVSGARNVISGNLRNGILMSSSYTVVSGNFVGTNASGTGALLNSISGIQSSGSNNLFGGFTRSERNVVVGSSSAISLSGEYNSRISGNYIGTDVTGTIPLSGNGSEGVRMFGHPADCSAGVACDLEVGSGDSCCGDR
ncbi:MAG: LamG domain-containing protein [Planctomycetaceae bacterium]